MKRFLLAALAVALLPVGLFAQTVPLQISYQGRVTDAGGVAVGNGTAVNRTVIFRIWSHATDTAAGSRLYSEQQTVTIASGEFSVLIGAGTAVSGEAKPALDTIFSGTTALPRFIGITVDDGTTAADPEISPRQQIVSDVYSFRAKIADTVLAGGINTAQIANNAVTSVLISDSAVGSSKIADLLNASATMPRRLRRSPSATARARTTSPTVPSRPPRSSMAPSPRSISPRAP